MPNRRVGFIGGAVLGFATAAALVYAQVPHTFVEQTRMTISSQQMDENFSDLDQRIRKPVIEMNGRQYSLGAVYCGATAPTDGRFSSGVFTGLQAAKGSCETIAGCSPSAHMCTSEEISRSIQLGEIPPGGWYSTMVWRDVTGDSAIARDCKGWSIDSPGIERGSILEVEANGPPTGSIFSTITGCDSILPILCCDR